MQQEERENLSWESQGVWNKPESECGLVPASPVSDQDGIPTVACAVPQMFITEISGVPHPHPPARGAPSVHVTPSSCSSYPKPQPFPTES